MFSVECLVFGGQGRVLSVKRSVFNVECGVCVVCCLSFSVEYLVFRSES